MEENTDKKGNDLLHRGDDANRIAGSSTKGTSHGSPHMHRYLSVDNASTSSSVSSSQSGNISIDINKNNNASSSPSSSSSNKKSPTLRSNPLNTHSSSLHNVLQVKRVDLEQGGSNINGISKINEEKEINNEIINNQTGKVSEELQRIAEILAKRK